MADDIKNYCCGLSLKRATIAIGVIQAILAFIFFVLCLAYSNHPGELIEMSDPSIVPKTESLKTILFWLALASIMQCIFSILIIFGAGTNRPQLLLPWLIFNPISIIVYVLGTLLAMFHHSGLHRAPFILGHFVIGFFVCVLGGYNIVTVRALYNHLKGLNF